MDHYQNMRDRMRDIRADNQLHGSTKCADCDKKKSDDRSIELNPQTNTPQCDECFETWHDSCDALDLMSANLDHALSRGMDCAELEADRRKQEHERNPYRDTYLGTTI